MFPNKYKLNTDFATLKNDTQSNVISVTIPSGMSYNPENPILGEVFLEAGKINAGLRARAYTSKYPNDVFIGLSFYTDISVSIPSLGMSFVQSLYCNLDRISPTTVRLKVGTDGSSGAPTHVVNETQVITFVFSTFLSPFDD